MISDEARQIRTTLGQPSGAPAQTIEEQRRGWEAAVADAPLPPGVTITPARDGAVPGIWADAERGSRQHVLVLLHGGGFSTGSSITHRELAARLALASGVRVLVPDYRLVPEHPFPAGLHDAADVYAGLLDAGIPAAQIALAGDSAGANLALAALLEVRARGLPLPGAAALLSPWLDLTVSDPSFAERAALDPLVSRGGLAGAAHIYLGDADPRQPLASPLYGDLRGLPPLLVQIGGDEVLLSDASRLDERARAAGGDVTLEVWPGMWHVWHGWAAALPEGREAIERIGAFVAQHLIR